MTGDDSAALQRRLDRERQARREAELIAERTTRDLYETVNQLRHSQAESDDRAALVTLLQRSAVAANEAADLEEAAQLVLDAVCAHTGWPVGHLYVADGQGLHPSTVWHLDDPERYAEFRCVTEATPLRFGEGLPGRVMAKGKPAWITDVNRDNNFPRARLCADSGVKAGFGFPVVAGNEVVAVLEFFSPDALEPNTSLLASMAHIGSQLGRVVERTRARAALQASEEQHRLVIETANDAFIAIDANSTIIDWNRQAEATFGWSRREAIGQSLTETIIPEAHIAAHEHGVTRYVTTGEGPVLGRRMELTGVHRDGHEFPIELTVWAAQTDGAVRFNAFVHDISERKAFEHRLEHQALHDPLTGLPNRALFLDRLAHALSRTQRQGRSVGVLFLDLDRFKSVNDSLGHEAGDRLLLGVAARVPAALRNGDTLARLGGDEFVILCEDLDGADGALRVAERVQQGLRGPFTLPNGVVSITASIGIAASAAADAAPDQLLADADLAMYRAKERGRGLCELFDEEIRARLVERLASEKALRRAVEQHELLTYYQPIVELRGGNVVGVEALLRWHRPDTGLVLAAEFVPLAEETGLITPMGEGVMRDACAQLTTWPTGDEFVCAVNVSVHELGHHSFVEKLMAILEAESIAPGRIVLEVTESVMMHDARGMIRRLWELRELGFGLAIDDFGTGYSSLDRLRRMPVDRLKIDKSFIRDMGATPTGTPLVAAIIAMAHGLGLTVVAEGVETPFQFQALRRLGCNEAQGYLFGRPAPADDIVKAVGLPTVSTLALLEEAGRRAAPQAVEAKLMNVVSEAMRGRGNVEYTTRSLLAELERLIGLDRTA